MPTPRELSQQIPAPGQKLGCKSPRVGANFWCKSTGVCGGGMVMAAIDTCITGNLNTMLRLLKNTTFSTAVHCTFDIIKNVRTIFETLDARPLYVLCDVNTEGKKI